MIDLHSTSLLIYLSVGKSISSLLYLYVLKHQFIHLSFYLLTYLTIYQSICLFVFSSIYPSTYLPIYLYIFIYVLSMYIVHCTCTFSDSPDKVVSQLWLGRVTEQPGIRIYLTYQLFKKKLIQYISHLVQINSY